MVNKQTMSTGFAESAEQQGSCFYILIFSECSKPWAIWITGSQEKHPRLCQLLGGSARPESRSCVLFWQEILWTLFEKLFIFQGTSGIIKRWACISWGQIEEATAADGNQTQDQASLKHDLRNGHVSTAGTKSGNSGYCYFGDHRLEPKVIRIRRQKSTQIALQVFGWHHNSATVFRLLRQCMGLQLQILKPSQFYERL